MIVNKYTNLTENQECKIWMDYAQHIPLLKKYLIKIPNEGKRAIHTGRNLVNLGLRRGAPDYFIPIPSNGYHGLFIEMKRNIAIKSKISEFQSNFIEDLNNIGYLAKIAYGGLEAIKIYKLYMDKK
jgi:hypothetical protein